MKTMTTLPSRSRGLSIAGWMFVIIVVVVFGSVATKTVPAYMDFNTISTAINSALDDPKIGLMSTQEIQTNIDRRFAINNITVISGADLQVEKESGRVLIAVDYEVRKNLFSNLDLAMVFTREFERSVR